MKDDDFLQEPIYERAALVQPGLDGASTRKALQAALRALTSLPTAEFDHSHIRNSLYALASEQAIAREPLLAAICVAITGQVGCADLFGVMAALGKERVEVRIGRAVGELMVVA